MLKLRNVLVAFLALSVFTVLPAFPQGSAGCKTGKFTGAYTHLDTIPDVWGDASNVENQTIRQLTLHSDGTATADNGCGEPPIEHPKSPTGGYFAGCAPQANVAVFCDRRK